MLKNTTGLLASISGAVWREVSLTNARRNGHKLQQRTLKWLSHSNALSGMLRLS